MNIQTAPSITRHMPNFEQDPLFDLLTHLNDDHTVLALAKGLEVAVVVQETEQGQMNKLASVPRSTVMTMIMKDWIISDDPNSKIVRYSISQTGRAALRQRDQDALFSVGSDVAVTNTGLSAQSSTRSQRMRYGALESPLMAMARRKTKSGHNFLAKDLVAAGEQLREDYEVALIKQNQEIDWAEVIASGKSPDMIDDGATRRVVNALLVLGPGLGDVVYYCCCKLMGLEVVEQKMGWSARSGKIVMRIALQRLIRHYAENNLKNDMIG